MTPLCHPIGPIVGCVLLVAGCVSADGPPSGTPYFEWMTPGGLLYADTSMTFYADGTFSYLVSDYPDGTGWAQRTSGPAPGAYEAALAAVTSPTPQELAAEQARLAPAVVEPHDPPLETCTHFDGTQARTVGLFACQHAASPES